MTIRAHLVCKLLTECGYNALEVVGQKYMCAIAIYANDSCVTSMMTSATMYAQRTMFMPR